jgi:hypothetical protein
MKSAVEPSAAGEAARLASVELFHRDGVAMLPGVFSREEAALLRSEADAIFADPELKEQHRHGLEFVIARLYRGPDVFRQALARAPIPEVVDAILGPGCAVVGLNVIRNAPSQAVSHWHVDDTLELPLPPEVPRFDPRMRMPVTWLTVQVSLTDIETPEHGPMQYVAGSHYSGRRPNDPDHPSFEGCGPSSVYCRAGDAYLLNHQCWHRGAPNTSDRIRYVMQLQFGARWAIRRFTGTA